MTQAIGWPIAALACALWPAPAGAQPPPPTPAASPGAIALSMFRPAPEALAAVTAGLADARAGVRAAAARAALVMGAPAAAPEVARALAAETDLDAAHEEVHALAVLGGAEAEKTLLEAAARLRPDLAASVADALARTGRAGVLAAIPRLRDAGLQSPREMVRIVIARQPDALVPPAAVAVGAADAATWRALLEVARDTGYSLPEALVTASLTSRSADVRQASYEHVAAVTQGTAPSEPLRAALAAAPEAADAASAGAAFAYELARRAAGEAARPQDLLLGRLVPDATSPWPPFLSEESLTRLLTDAERKALQRTLGADALPPPSPAGKASARRPATTAAAGRIRLASGFPVGFAGDVVRASGCRPAEREVAAAEVKYRADGRPEKVTLLAAPAAPGCRDAAVALFTASVAPSSRLAGDVSSPDVLILKFDDDYLSCLDEPSFPVRSPDSAAGARRVRGSIKEPRKVRNVVPVYPAAAKQQRVQGVVILEATISRTGCVLDAGVLTGHPMLGAAAVSAVAGWRYTPTLLNGVPVPVIMTVTVNYRLQ